MHHVSVKSIGKNNSMTSKDNNQYVSLYKLSHKIDDDDISDALHVFFSDDSIFFLTLQTSQQNTIQKIYFEKCILAQLL